jgi:hypothetical protein
LEIKRCWNEPLKKKSYLALSLPPILRVPNWPEGVKRLMHHQLDWRSLTEQTLGSLGSQVTKLRIPSPKDSWTRPLQQMVSSDPPPYFCLYLLFSLVYLITISVNAYKYESPRAAPPYHRSTISDRVVVNTSFDNILLLVTLQVEWCKDVNSSLLQVCDINCDVTGGFPISKPSTKSMLEDLQAPQLVGSHAHQYSHETAHGTACCSCSCC